MRTRASVLILSIVCIISTLVLFRTGYKAFASERKELATNEDLGGDRAPISMAEMIRSQPPLEQHDLNLIREIRKNFLVPPSNLSYNLARKEIDPSKGQSRKIRELLKDKRNGFFVECGALDGETRSNTLWLEQHLGWSGVLIEGNPRNFDLLRRKNRKAWSLSACLSLHPYPEEVMFTLRFNVGKISSASVEDDATRPGMARVTCLPLYSILVALNRTTVDYFSLDVEGHELDVLRTIPWSKVNITTLSVEFIHGAEGKQVLKQFMEDRGYRVFAEVTFPGGLANDFIFYHPHLLNSSDSSLL